MTWLQEGTCFRGTNRWCGWPGSWCNRLSQTDVLSALYFRQIDSDNEKFGQDHPVWPESPIIHK